MTTNTFSLIYQGYWREANVGYIPNAPGVYSAYTCQFSSYNNSVTIKKLIYIGESGDVGRRIEKHERWNDWRRYLSYGQELCFNFAPIVAGRERVEAALINAHKPPVNTEYVNNFPYPTTTVYTSGKSALLSAAFIVQRTLSSTYSI